MKYFPILCVLSLLIAPLNCQAQSSLLGKPSQPEHVVVNNRVLAKVNGKAISAIDLMKKMDLLFYKEYPQYALIPEARYQFYQANWKSMLKDLINKELILADAEENKLQVSSGEVRQEMEHLFGPNIITNLDKIGMTFDEAWKIIQGDIQLHRMLFIRVNSKATREVTPKIVFGNYEEFAKENIVLDKWSYRVISIRDKDPTVGAAAANVAYQLLTIDQVPLSELAEKLKNHSTTSKSTINISDLFVLSGKEVSPAYMEILEKMKPKTYSTPLAQKSKDKSLVFRFFYLDEMNPGGVPPFKDVETKIKEKLLTKELNEKGEAYVKKLYQHFDVQEMIPEGYEPFDLK